MDKTYPQQLIEINIQLLQPFGTAKAPHLMQCIVCNHQWTATPISKIQAYRKYGTNGCPNCKDIRRYKQKREDATAKITSKGFLILSEYNGHQSTQQKITVQNTACGHTFDVAPGNLITRNVNCPVCNIEVKRERCNANSKALQDVFRASAPEWTVYKQTVYTLTINAYRKHRKTINPLGLKRGRAGEEGAYQVDHIVPVRWCFDNGVPPEVCADHTNLQMLGWLDNIIARDYIKEDTIVPDILEEYVNKSVH